MRPPDDLDVIFDGLALIEACHRDDLEGARVLLEHANSRLVAMFLARVGCDLIESLLDDDPAMFARLREHYS
jgi:hypothetical protein